MEIEFLLFPIQQLSKKLIRRLVNKVLLSGVLIRIKSLIKISFRKEWKNLLFFHKNICIVKISDKISKAW